MKHFRIILLLSVLALVLCACAGTPETYQVSLDGNRVVTIQPDAGIIRYGSDIYRYKIKSTWGGERYELTYPDGRCHTWTETEKTGEGTWSEGYGPSIYLPGELLVKALKQPASTGSRIPGEKKGNPVLGILCSLGGILLMVFHKHGASCNSRRFIRFGTNSRYGVEITPEEYAAFIFTDGVFLLIYGLYHLIF